MGATASRDAADDDGDADSDMPASKLCGSGINIRHRCTVSLILIMQPFIL